MLSVSLWQHKDTAENQECMHWGSFFQGFFKKSDRTLICASCKHTWVECLQSVASISTSMSFRSTFQIEFNILSSVTHQWHCCGSCHSMPNGVYLSPSIQNASLCKTTLFAAMPLENGLQAALFSLNYWAPERTCSNCSTTHGTRLGVELDMSSGWFNTPKPLRTTELLSYTRD